ncbi:3-hydroxyacyl-CoA dehydrogenase NAD-binding domain-containing protein [Methylobacterium nonmethylotrophicum]|uniref:3-hydroxyacyl-CoA dehydrogenase n=1 Tax=Methylobacterium nonmethylotrophicum TaxID=1141884 RepID=A0A4Z0NLX1_9HYPH|nr:3-hydroxyacyl-CoA dehydrogenase NAD-binding domain-containing protein [Methylobacterium nonmethylotrophicum]TGD97465.1 3-hydroxyacyl-CoA dehydrogenase [Methylobacterium nonmethylotrophicum]
MDDASQSASGYRTAIGRVAVIGTGVIGASWVSQFLAQGLDVTATDPAPGAETRLRETVARHWPVLAQIGLASGASPERLTFVAEPDAAVEGADFVQENGPERLEIKRDTYRRLDAAAPPDVVLATSSSGLAPSAIQDACRYPGRVVLGHPFNPPHLVPLVEVLGGRQTDEGAIAAAMTFYVRIGKQPIRLRREMVGHVANRLQAALWREAFHLVGTGAATVADIDAAIAHGPGLRWALMGPCLLNHLSGGPGGLAHTLDHLGPLMEAMWADLGDPRLTPELKQTLVRGLGEALAGRDLDAMVAARDRLLVDLVRRKREAPELP